MWCSFFIRASISAAAAATNERKQKRGGGKVGSQERAFFRLQASLLSLCMGYRMWRGGIGLSPPLFIHFFSSAIARWQKRGRGGFHCRSVAASVGMAALQRRTTLPYISALDAQCCMGERESGNKFNKSSFLSHSLYMVSACRIKRRKKGEKMHTVGVERGIGVHFGLDTKWGGVGTS